ncbi:MAG: hypothetical protein HN774_01895 [Bacteroidetes Order II. Incertae sedis bacterium]|jgi:prophage DNA circulation protein|nr:hypothetical protein [Bacteroidetes Order II. bacterium]
MKKITVELTDSQATWLMTAMQTEIDASREAIEDAEDHDELTEANLWLDTGRDTLDTIRKGAAQ